MLGEGLIEVPGISASLLSAIDSSMLLPSTETATARQPLVFYDSTGYYSAARHGNSNDATAANTSDAPWQYDFAILVLYAGLSASEHDQGGTLPAGVFWKGKRTVIDPAFPCLNVGQRPPPRLCKRRGQNPKFAIPSRPSCHRVRVLLSRLCHSAREGWACAQAPAGGQPRLDANLPKLAPQAGSLASRFKLPRRCGRRLVRCTGCTSPLPFRPTSGPSSPPGGGHRRREAGG